LEDILERNSKRLVPLRSKDDSPEMQPSKKKQIVEVQANAAAIIKQTVEIKREHESAGSAIIRHEPGLRLDSLGDIVSIETEGPDRTASIEISRREVEARRNIKKAELADPDRTAAIERGRQIVEARRKALVVTETATNLTKSPSREKYLGLDKAAQDTFHDRASEYKESNRRVSPTPDLFQHYNAARDTHLSDGQLGVMALEAWMSHLRRKHEYLPDQEIASSVHLDHLKVLSSALSDFKRQRTALNLWGEDAISYRHERYSVICQKYRISAETCSPKELMRSVERRDMNVLYRKRCCQLNKFYSMLIKDTPGYIPAPDYKDRGPQSRATEPKPAPSGNIRRNPAIKPMAGRVETNQWTGAPPSTTTLDMLISTHILLDNGSILLPIYICLSAVQDALRNGDSSKTGMQHLFAPDRSEATRQRLGITAPRTMLKECYYTIPYY
jgi:hypothetical protein